ncbi:hypothetical protein DM01DRAFT_1384704 [Hesseltinella vesiculosa]|uniref:Uncharacterized protein n=1 Tax=Hesseltinella vesiculosa TaxID=101127 RepID=A0A1X2GD32_9FUNG|nr:hypothetical protein DM01DRAFT_1384704 [Hesseltinella vesiculosa]
MFSFGTAACIGYDLAPTEDNKLMTKNRLEAAGLIPVTLTQGGHAPEDVTFASVDAVAKRPWKYNTFPLSPILGGKRSIENLEPESLALGESEDSESTEDAELTVLPSQRSVMTTLKLLLHKKPLGDITNPEFVTEGLLFNIISPYLPPDSVITKDKVGDWVGKDGSFGPIKRRWVNGKRERGRPLHVVKNCYRDFTIDHAVSYKAVREQLRAEQDLWLTIGYVRKSEDTKITNETRKGLLELMAHKLKLKMLCRSVYASWSSSASSSMIDRDHEPLPELVGVDGSTQDMVELVTSTTKNVTIVAIDYAGLTTSPDDLHSFLKMAKKVKRIIIDHGDHPELITRRELLHVDGVIGKFACRKPCLRGSTV